MPTREVLASFWRDWDRLTKEAALACFELLERRHLTAAETELLPKTTRSPLI